MGTDVHAVFQKRDGDKWVEVKSTWEQRRHYFLFSWLADVRNGFGFAGVPTYTPVTPISKPRGLPPDFDEERDGVKWDDDDEPSGYIGDHTFSWLMASEILAAPRPTATRTGVVERAFLDGWDGRTPPEAWSGGISGAGVEVAESPAEIKPTTTHVRISWPEPNDSLNYFVDEIERLHAEHGDVRLVFGFDS